jgi:hypothetical protein
MEVPRVSLRNPYLTTQKLDQIWLVDKSGKIMILFKINSVIIMAQGIFLHWIWTLNDIF